MAKIQYLNGDALRPKQSEAWQIIAQVVNDVGRFGAGFAAQTAKEWPEVKKRYMAWRLSSTFKLGNIEMFLPATFRKLSFALLLAQHGLPGQFNDVPLDYEALDSCLMKLGEFALEMNAELHMPKIGCGLARAKWELVSKMIEERIPEIVRVFVYVRV